MSKGEVPIAYIIALILGVAVIAVLGYWFFVVQGTGGAQMSITECSNKAFMYCTLWSANGYLVDGGAPDLGVLNGGIRWFATTHTPDGAYASGCTSFPLLQGFAGSKTTAGTIMYECVNNVLGGQ